MPSVSTSQQRLFGQVRACQTGRLKHPSAGIKALAKHMSKTDVLHFASTVHKGLPKHVKLGVMNEKLLALTLEQAIKSGASTEQIAYACKLAAASPAIAAPADPTHSPGVLCANGVPPVNKVAAPPKVKVAASAMTASGLSRSVPGLANIADGQAWAPQAQGQPQGQPQQPAGQQHPIDDNGPIPAPAEDAVARSRESFAKGFLSDVINRMRTTINDFRGKEQAKAQKLVKTMAPEGQSQQPQMPQQMPQ
jgi:hypothetical protein